MFNAERGRGIVHTPKYVSLMAGEQRRFDEWQAERRPEMTAVILRRTVRHYWWRRLLMPWRRLPNSKNITMIELGGGPPFDGPEPSGVREPRSPRPSGPSQREAIEDV
jgi:hypothetical protein